MKSAATVLSLLLCVSVFGKDAKVRTDWTRSFQNTYLSIISDHQGRVAAFGSDTNSDFIRLFNKNGRDVRRLPIPFFGMGGAIADNSGRIFVTGNEPRSSIVRVAAFGPDLSGLLWVQERNMSNAYAPPTTAISGALTLPTEDGAAYVFGGWHRGFYLAEFRGQNSGVFSIWDPQSGATRWPVAAVRSQSGACYFVGGSVSLHYPWVTIQKLTPATQELITVGYNSPPGAFSLPAAATCDTDGNLIVVGWYADDPRTSFDWGNCFVRKMDPDMNTIWQARWGLFTGIRGSSVRVARAVAVDRRGEIVVTGDAGTAKFGPDGSKQWESAEIGMEIQLDQKGNIILARRAGRDGRDDGIYDLEITKLNRDGVRRWKTHLLDSGNNETWLAGLVVDEYGNVYVGKQTGDTATIVKLH